MQILVSHLGYGTGVGRAAVVLGVDGQLTAELVGAESVTLELGPVESVPGETYGPLGPIFATVQPSSSTHTREALGWEPTHSSLLDDLEHNLTT